MCGKFASASDVAECSEDREVRDLLEWDVLDSSASSSDWVSEFELGEPSSVLVDEEVAELSSLSVTFDLLRLMNLGIAQLMLSKTSGAKLMCNTRRLIQKDVDPLLW